MSEATPVKLIDNIELAGLYPDLVDDDLTLINYTLTRFIQEYCNTTFEAIEYTDEIYDSRAEIRPEHRPIISVESLAERTEVGATPVALVEDLDYYVYPDRILIVNPYKVRKGIILSYTAGLETIPQMASRVALDLANYWYFKDSEGSLLFYSSQTLEEREYKTRPDLSEITILRRLSALVQPRNSGRGKQGIRIGVM